MIQYSTRVLERAKAIRMLTSTQVQRMVVARELSPEVGAYVLMAQRNEKALIRNYNIALTLVMLALVAVCVLTSLYQQEHFLRKTYESILIKG